MKVQSLLSLLLLCLLYFHPTLSGGYILPEYRALLSVKSSITHDPFSALSTWNASTSHCNWKGITCHPSSRRVIALDLSNLLLSGTLSSDLSNLRFLSELSVAGNDLSGAIPAELSSLSALRVLDLSYNRFNGTFPSQLSLLKNLQVLDLSGNYMIGDLPLAVTQMPNLRHLNLGENSFSGRITSQFGQWKFLEYLDVSYNDLEGPIPQEIGNLTNLRELYIGGYTSMYCGIPSEIGNLSELVSFRANSCNLSGEIPAWFAELKNLRLLQLSDNKLHGAIPEFIADMPELEKLYLWENNFSGIIPQRLGRNGKLQVLILSSNNLTGTLPPDMCFGNQLEILSTRENLLVGPIPDALGRCESLSRIVMEHNFLNGSIPRDLFGLPNLTYVMLQNNRLTGKFPIFSRNDSKLGILDISDNKVHGEVPSWIWRLPYLVILNLSHNCLETLDENLNSPNTSQSSLKMIDLQSNQLQGQLSTLPLHFLYTSQMALLELTFFSVSRNKFDGAIPTSLCNATTLNVLDLSHNHLTGMIPQCLIEMSGVLSVMGNNLTGVIPDSFPFNCNLEILVLNGNQLEGELPKSLDRCNATLGVLDIGNNLIQDTFPCYLKNIDTLRVLILRSNQFHGSINCLDANTTWSKLQILDLASNHFVGKFPICYFSSWKAMMGTEKEMESKGGSDHIVADSFSQDSFSLAYQIRVNLTLKGQDLEFEKILTIITSLDLSCNSFDGDIPKEIGEFKVLYALNLSHNAFTGQIPQALVNLRALESLDLSSNKLIGEIPLQLADCLTFLSTLNLSFNQLVGKIPQIRQFATFSESSFEGNIGLCDFPMKEKCIHEELGPSAPPYSVNSIDWDFLSVELGFVFGLGIFIGPLIFWTRWRKRYYKHVDDIVFKMFPRTYIRIENYRSGVHKNEGRQARKNQGGR
ncbi:hypothetical protein I3843_08G141600 [Carya illinoinensis]|uniref:Leucine-rich repeat-containing N-terminal plant-type domain-containing protein n=1 Tax=Carya illinoinensis TaxID=32201 RepID=A0A8T1PRU0_CARIL|nr:leucine-rich repeat receptor-like serine/threonine-protein kinase BAM1 [Carya illinoinensis]KAG6645795.1 hypothetical protein CIPAW_08G147600 [Carya illinoinensis]KAG7968207.1 hypothetical protein I3843_08G141600 [Carya illinoinensis]